MKFNLVIPAAGTATRLRPLSSNSSKAMVRVNGKPCIDFILERALEEGTLEQVVIIDGAYDDIRQYVKRRWSALNITFVKQESLVGPHNAILIGAKQISNLEIPSVVWLGDAIILEPDLPLGSDFLLCKDVSDHHNWCMWDPIKDTFHNKPSKSIPDSVALVGLYSFTHSVRMLQAFSATQGSYEISDALEAYGTTFSKVMTESWYDIGEISSYYKTCASLLSLKSRAFNRIDYDQELSLINKRPDYHNMHAITAIENEKAWYRELDWKQKLFVPRFIDNSDALTLSYEPGVLLSDLLLYEDMTESTWSYIIDRVFHIITEYFHKNSDRKFDSIYTFSTNCKKIWVDKSESRLKDTWFDTSERGILSSYAQTIYKKALPVQCMHGDLHFGNILYNAQNDKFSFIDPRGEYGTLTGTIGDNIYDWAKLAHELVFGYSHIVANVAYLRKDEMTNIFKRMCKKYGVDYDLAVKGGVLLLATCIPLHTEDYARQERMASVVKNYLKESV